MTDDMMNLRSLLEMIPDADARPNHAEVFKIRNGQSLFGGLDRNSA